MDTTYAWSTLGHNITACMLFQQSSLRHRVRKLRRQHKQGKNIASAYTQLEQAIKQAQQQRQQRQQQRPCITYPPDLPISHKRDCIAKTIEQHQVTIIAGETGSGKTTQIPKICLELGRGIAGMIGHSQPRRIAARSVATRIAEELKTPLGQAVGYKIRFSDHSQSNTYIKLMTDGILLAEIQHDPQLLKYDTIIIDEAHERSLNIDFLLGYLKNILPKRPDLKLIITSATINTQRFSTFFNQAPVIEVSGRNFAVDIEYLPFNDDGLEDDKTLQQAIVHAVHEAETYDAMGDILIFLPGEREIRDTAHSLQQQGLPHTEILPLFSRLSPAEQDKIFKRHTGRRIVLATNVAETSLTVPGIRFVIDTGVARVSRYSAKSKVQQLPIEAISQASANQRAGRCGRVAAGICFRLYSEDNFNRRPEHTDPEILRTNLANVILHMNSLGLGDIQAFDFMQAPEKRSIQDGYRLLEELQSIDKEGKLTAIGKQLVRLPVDPRLGRMLVQAQQERALHEVLIIVAALSVQDPKIRPADNTQKADEKHLLFTDKTSDFLSWVKLWHWYHEQARQLSKSKLRKVCTSHFLSYLRMREWHDLHGQLLGIVRELKMVPNQDKAQDDAVHKSILAGLLSHVVKRVEDTKKKEKAFLGARGLHVSLFPGSPLSKKPPSWLMAASLLETSRLFARCLAPIDPTWLEQLAPHLIKHRYSEPHWSKKRAQVCALENITLYGLPIINKRNIHFGPIEPDVSRTIFIRHALVYQAFHSFGKWLKHNQALCAEIETLEAKSRRRDLMGDEQTRFDFFDRIIPQGVYNGKLFEQWRKKIEKEQPNILFLSKKVLLEDENSDFDAQKFPNQRKINGLNLKLSYHFDPSQQHDGITVSIPLMALGQLQAQDFEWLVPGLLEEKITSLIKGLPKVLRKNFVPAPQYARACAEHMPFAQGSLLSALSQQLQRMTGTKVSSQDWNIKQLPQHLHMKFSIVDEQGKIIATDSHLSALQHQYAHLARTDLQNMSHQQVTPQQGITRWDFGDLAPVITQKKHGMSICLYPALVDEQRSVSIALFESEQSGQQAMFAGVRRLLMLTLHQQVILLRKSISKQAEMVLLYACFGQSKDLLDDVLIQTFDCVFMQHDLPRNTHDFNALLDAGRAQVITQGQRIADDVLQILQDYTALQHQLEGVRAAALKPVAEDIQQQIGQLLGAGFVRHTPHLWLQHLSRFLQAAAMRLSKAGQNLQQDKLYSQEINQFWQAYQHEIKQRQQQGEPIQNFLTFRWHIEELRVALFAQSLKTSLPVSVKRLKKTWAQCLT